MCMRTIVARTITLKTRERETDIDEYMRGCCVVCVRFISIETGCLKHIKLNLTRVPVIHYSFGERQWCTWAKGYKGAVPVTKHW